MRDNRTIVLYSFWLFIILLGAGVFLLRGQIIGLLGQRTIIPTSDSLLSLVKKNNPETLDLGILADKRFVNLKNETGDFNFDNFNENSVIGPDGTLITIPGATSTEASSSVVFVTVKVGNNNPFSQK